MKKTVLFLSAYFFLISAAFSSSDACDTVPGKWKGKWNVYGYLCPTVGMGHNIDSNIYFDFYIYECGDLDQNFTMSGTCKEGNLTLANSNATMTGTIADNQILITGDGQQAFLQKE